MLYLLLLNTIPEIREYERQRQALLERKAARAARVKAATR
jgi:hypothetical protein